MVLVRYEIGLGMYHGHCEQIYVEAKGIILSSDQENSEIRQMFDFLRNFISRN